MPRVLSVGQCSLDHGVLSRYLETHFGADVVAATSAADTLRQLELDEFDLILVNRRFDADGGDGVALIRRLHSSGICRNPVMLVSNYREAQSAAVAAGAVPGFGKANYGDPEMLDRLARALVDSVESKKNG